MTDAKKTAFTLFILAELITFGMITLLQFLDNWLFILTLITMHGGILLFIVSKKKFLKEAVPVKPYFRIAYLLLALYLPVLITKLVMAILKTDAAEGILQLIVIIITAVAVLVSIVNTVALAKNLRTI